MYSMFITPQIWHSPLCYYNRQEDADPKRKRFSEFPESEVKTIEKEYPRGKLAQYINSITRFVENYKLHIFWVVLYTLICAGIFIERAYCKLVVLFCET